MKILNKLFSKKTKKKGLFDSAINFGNMYEYFSRTQDYLITKTLAISYYTKCSPIYNAIDLIATAISSLPPQVYDKEAEIWVKNHPVLDLLNLPNADITWQEFIYAVASYYMITGDAYVIASGAPQTPPKELYCYPSQSVIITPGKDGFAQTLQTTLYWGSDIYTRDEVDKRFRYYNTRNTAEIWHIKQFNPMSDPGNLYGMSQLNPIYYEINQHQSANQHNLSVLTHGATTSGILTLNPSVDADEFAMIQEQMEKMHSGPNNAGKMMLLNWGLNYQSTNMTNKDMDFLELKKEVTNAIYKNLRIPLALVNTESMTLDNFNKSVITFYDQAVLPLANRIFNELSRLLLPRYNGSDNLILSYEAGDITALESRRNEQLGVLKNLELFTTNQLRAMVGASPLIGGNAIYGQSTQIPIATDPGDNSIQLAYDDLPALDDVGGDDEKMGAKGTTRARFVEILSSKVDGDGNPLFTAEEINNLADKHGLK